MQTGKQPDASASMHSKAPKRFFYRLYLAITWVFMKIVYRVRFIRDKHISSERGPYFIVGNHVSYLDPVLCLLSLNRLAVRFVAGEEVVSGKMLRILLAPLSVIHIKPFRVNYSTTREIIESIKSGISVALFPETQRSISGDMTPFGLSTAKLIKHIRVPVASAFSRGGYLGWPRWAKIFRPGHIEMETTLLFTKEETEKLPLHEIQRRLEKALATEDYAWQLNRRHPVRYFSLKPAAGLSKICHWCPVCDKPLSMESRKRTLRCVNCGQAFRLDASGFFSASPGSRPVFDHPLEFARWQRRRLVKAFEEGQEISDRCRLEFRETVGQGITPPERRSLQGIGRIVKDGLLFEGDDRGKIFFPLGETPSLYTMIGLYADVLSDKYVWRLYPESEGFTSLLTDCARSIWEHRNGSASCAAAEVCSPVSVCTG